MSFEGAFLLLTIIALVFGLAWVVLQLAQSDADQLRDEQLCHYAPSDFPESIEQPRKGSAALDCAWREYERNH